MKKNILLIISDQHRADTMSSLGQTDCNTPNLDRLCREGIWFDQAVCTWPLCGPSRTSIFTGIYPYQAKGVLLPDNLGTRGPDQKDGAEADMMTNFSSVKEKA